MSTAVSNAAMNNAVNSYTYSYQGKLQPKLDKNDDAVWDRSELQNYADAYNKATGKSLDVDSIMEKYANADGVIDYKAQQAIRSDDALGLSALTSTQASSGAASSASDSGSASAQAMSRSQRESAIAAVRQYTYDYSGKLQPLLDKNDDGLWSRDELTNYADAYNKATGKTLDVDALIEQYGNSDGYIDPKNQTAMKKADALGLGALQEAYTTAINTPDKAPTNKEVVYWDDAKDTQTDYSGYSIEDLLSTMSPERKMAYSVAVNRLDTQSNMLNAMLSGSGGGSFDMFGVSSALNSARLYNIQSGGDSSSLYNAMSGNMLNFTI